MTTKNPKEYYSKREKFDKPDECYTPENAIYPLLPYIKCSIEDGNIILGIIYNEVKK